MERSPKVHEVTGLYWKLAFAWEDNPLSLGRQVDFYLYSVYALLIHFLYTGAETGWLKEERFWKRSRLKGEEGWYSCAFKLTCPSLLAHSQACLWPCLLVLENLLAHRMDGFFAYRIKLRRKKRKSSWQSIIASNRRIKLPQSKAKQVSKPV